MRKRHEYQIGHIYNLMQLLGLYRNPDDGNTLYAECRCVECGHIKEMRARQLFDNKYTS